jgi:hypothetical protein
MTGNSSFCVVGVSRGSDFGYVPRFPCQIQITDAIVKNMQRHVFNYTEKRKHCRPNETDSSTSHWAIDFRSGTDTKAVFSEITDQRPFTAE